MQVILDAGSAPIWGGKKGEFRDLVGVSINIYIYIYICIHLTNKEA